MAEQKFNPLDKKNLGLSVAKALLERPETPMNSLTLFPGAGVYALYLAASNGLYKGYLESLGENVRRPIYVGKAVPAGARKGGYGLDMPAGNVLFNRLMEHRESIQNCSDFKRLIFTCKYLVTDDIWIALAEAVLIYQFQPIWNVEIEGFGNHDPGAGRRLQRMSHWDCLHKGRQFAKLLQPRPEPLEQLESRVRFIKGKKPAEISVEKAVTEEE